LAATNKERMCCVCRTRKPITELIRVARIEGKYIIDEKGNANGRGCHICQKCVPQAIKSRALNKSFKTKIPDEIYDTLANHASKEYTVGTEK